MAENALDRLEAELEAWLEGWRLDDPPLEGWARLTALVGAFHAEIERLDPDDQTSYRDWWRERFHPWFLQSPAIDRAWEKPLGYAGDHVVLEHLYRNQPEGGTPLGRMLTQWLGHSWGATAVRSRRRWILLEMQRHAARRPAPWRLLSVANGGAWELRDLLAESFLPAKAEILCLDESVEALTDAARGFTSAGLRHGLTCPISFHPLPIQGLLRGEFECPPQDFAYSLALCDALSDASARRLIAALYALLAPGGRLILGFTAPSADNRAILALVMDWWPVYRDAAQVAALAADLPAEAEVSVEPDSTGSMGFLVVDRPA